MTKAYQGQTQSEKLMEANAKGIESKSTSSILNLDPLMAQLQGWIEKSGLDVLAISQKPEYLSKTEDTSKMYSRFTFYQKVVAPQIMGAELNILIGVVAIVSAVFTGGGSLLLYTLVAGELILGAADIKINVEKLGDLYDGEYYTNPKFLGMDQDVINVLGLIVGGAELGLGLKALLKSGDLAANARYIDDLEDILDDTLDLAEWDTKRVSGQFFMIDKNGNRKMRVSDFKKFKNDMDKVGIKVIIDKVKVPKGKAGGFDPETGFMYFRGTPSQIAAFHESIHAKQWLELGKEKYLAQSILEREEHVYKTIMENKNNFTRAELTATERYICLLRYNKKAPFGWPPADSVIFKGCIDE